MSFSTETKSELCRVKADRKGSISALCYGILLYCHTFTAEEIRIITACADFAAILPKLFRRGFGVSFDRLPKENAGGKLSFVITDREKIRRIAAAFGADVDGLISHHVNFAALEEERDRLAYIRGAFLAGGSVSDPEKGFHLELATTHRSVSRETYSLLVDMGYEPKESERGANSLIYFKKADNIADLLTAIGADVASMNVINAKVEREMRNTITRQINCDSANADKVVAAAQEQIDAIRYIAREYGLDALSEPLKDAALLRLTNPEASLADLAQLSSPKVTKSSLSYRLKKIVDYADEARSFEE